ncbi:MAG: acyltransferase, partial [Prevotellaceae bacterium]|nr:acyltransferase [Prevotellaceae bacterium]
MIHIDDIIKRDLRINDDVILDLFNFQSTNCEVYGRYVRLLGARVLSVNDIPFLPIEFFKIKRVYSSNSEPQTVFTSSGTTGADVSKHFVADANIYKKSYTEGFRYFFGDVSQYAVLALLPSYLERRGSSLITMVQGLIADSGNPLSGFFLNNHEALFKTLQILQNNGTPTLLIGVSFALLDFLEKFNMRFPELLVMETGGMKGRREEITREKLHSVICSGFGVNKILSEYGMTELLSQAYSVGNGRYNTVPWMKIIIRDPKDPFLKAPDETLGGVNVIDLANIYSCSFIETQDLGIAHSDGSFEIMGRFDESDIRG